jgi:hypothetical protein
MRHPLMGFERNKQNLYARNCFSGTKEKLCRTPNYNFELFRTAVNNFHMSILQFYFSNPIRGCLKKKSYRYMDVSGACWTLSQDSTKF